MRARAERLIDLVVEAEVDALLVTNLVNIRYLTGYTGSSGLAVVGPRTRAFITDFRYLVQTADEVHPSFARLRGNQDLIDMIAAALPEGELALGFEEAHTSVLLYTRLRELLPERIELVGTSGLVERLRAVKEPEEVDRIRAASSVADAALDQLLGEGLVGRTERELALALELEMRRQGARRQSFEPIVASGPHGARPHAQPRDVEIATGDLVVIDWGAELDGYCSDCTRTVAAGDPGEEERYVYDLVLAAQLAGLAGVREGADGREIDRRAREVIEHGGHGEHYGHGLGHGVGLEVHEAPRLSQRSTDTLRAGNVVTIEPGIYLPGRFGVRIEDLVVTTENGCEILTSLPKTLTIVD